MILKPYQLSNLKKIDSNFFLLYGQNEGHKNDCIKNILDLRKSKNIFRYDEDEIFNDYDSFINGLSNKSFFEDNKVIIISRVSERIYALIQDIKERSINDINIIINSKLLDKRSKLRSNFEKERDLICVPFYSEDNSSLAYLANRFFIDNKIPISREMINLLVDRCRGDRINLKNELSKIEAFVTNKKKITISEILNLTNLAENYGFSELADACLSKNRKKTLLIINENFFSPEDCITIIRIFLNKAKRIFALKKMQEEGKNIDQCILAYKPQIFWKDKEIVKQQVNKWTLDKIIKFITFINEAELLLKKNNSNAVILLNNFILEQLEVNN